MSTDVNGSAQTARVIPAHLHTDLVYGADALASELGLTKRQVYHAAAANHIPTFKIGAAICARRSTIVKWIEEQEQAARAHEPIK